MHPFFTTEGSVVKNATILHYRGLGSEECTEPSVVKNVVDN